MLILDSDILIHISNGTEQVIDRLQTAEDEVCTTVINQIELLQARYDYVVKAANGEELLRAQEWLDRTVMLLERFPAISIDRFSAAQFDSLRSQRKLRKIGRADMLIASIALAHDAAVVTRNIRHFGLIPRLKIENWVD